MSRPRIETAETLARRASGDALAAEKLAPHDDIGDGPIGFWAQQSVEKSIRVGLALRGVDFPMLAHGLDLLSALRRQPGVEPSDHLMPVPRTRPGYLIVPLVPDTSFEAIRKRFGTKPGTLADFEAEYGPVQPPDGEG
jgi:HEPN domain-containing protein